MNAWRPKWNGKLPLFLFLILVLIGYYAISRDANFYQYTLPNGQNSSLICDCKPQNCILPASSAEQDKTNHVPCNVEPWRPTDLERLSPKITGPRTSKPHLRALLTIPIGKKSAKIVNGTIYNFLNNNAGRVMLFAYDNYNWSNQTWYDDERVILIRHLKQMKWWFIKRFVSPLVTEAYDYLWFSDDDAVFDWNPNDFMDILDKYNIELSQPAHINEPPCSRSVWDVTHFKTPSQGGGETGRWTNFVECGPLAIVSRDLWKRCLWNFLQEDLSSGFGLDDLWYHGCNKPRTAVIDKYQMCHASTKAASNSSVAIYDPHAEWPIYKRRFPNAQQIPFNRGRTLSRF